MNQPLSDYSANALPMREYWQLTIESFQQRVDVPQQRELLQATIDRQFLTAQAICSGIDLTTACAPYRDLVQQWKPKSLADVRTRTYGHFCRGDT